MEEWSNSSSNCEIYLFCSLLIALHVCGNSRHCVVGRVGVGHPGRARIDAGILEERLLLFESLMKEVQVTKRGATVLFTAHQRRA
jgi:hypothetical protein